MKIIKVENNKKKYLDLLLLGDEQESMIDLYLDKGDMFVAADNGVKAECVVVKCEDRVYELKNIAVAPEFQRMGYGKKLVEYILSYYNDCDTMYVGILRKPLISIKRADLKSRIELRIFLLIIMTILCLRMENSLLI